MNHDAAKLTFYRAPKDKGFGALAWYRRWKKAQTFGGESANVPCGTCHACCRTYSEIAVHPADHIPESDTEPNPHPVVDGRERILRRHADGSCIYLVNDRCSIYARRPWSCRAYDCREILVKSYVGTNEQALAKIALEKFGQPLVKEPGDADFLLAVRLAPLMLKANPSVVMLTELWRKLLPMIRHPEFKRAVLEMASDPRVIQELKQIRADMETR